MGIASGREREGGGRQTDRQTDRQSETEIERKTERQTVTDRQRQRQRESKGGRRKLIVEIDRGEGREVGEIKKRLKLENILSRIFF